MDGLEDVMISEISQAEKDKYHVFSFNTWNKNKQKTPNL